MSERATFGELVHAASVLDNNGESHSTAGCLVRDRGGLHLDADLSLAARPLPPVPERATDSIAEQVGSVGVMTTWGNVQGELSDAVLLAFTTTTTAAIKVPAIALFVTQQGVFVRGADPQIRAHASALSPEQVGTLLAQVTGPATVYVTADRSVTLHALLVLMRLIPNRFEVALAVALPKGTRLPLTAAESPEGLCPDGLPAPADDEAQGDLSRADAQAALAPLREAALACALQAAGRALLGGRLTLAVRIGSDGRAKEICFPNDEIHEPRLRRCIISSTRDLRLPQPQPTGFADMHLPLQLDLTGPTAQRASCD